MPADHPMSVVLCWHMHQPEYRDMRTGKVHLPWTYLHATKDYADMAAHLEAVPEARAVVNFAPILLEQIEDYIGQVAAYPRRPRRHRATRCWRSWRSLPCRATHRRACG